MATKMKEAKENMDRAATEFENTDYNVFKQGAAYDGLKKSYEQQGRMAMQDTIGQVAARTGGMASSFAQTAGQQSYNGYMQTLEDAARSMFESERQQKMNEFGIASSIYDRENSDYRYDKEWEYQKGRDKISDDRYKAESDYAMGRDKIADARYDAAAELESQATLSGETSPQYTFDVNEWDIALNNIETLPKNAAINYLTGLLQAGWPPDTVYGLAAQYETQNGLDILGSLQGE